MKKILIYGNTQFSVMVSQYVLEYTDNCIQCFTVDKEYINTSTLNGIPVLDFKKAILEYPKDKFNFIIALGYHQMNTLRERITHKIIDLGYKIENFIHPDSIIHSKKIGFGNIILDNVYLGYNTVLGNGNIIWHNSNISHDVEIQNYNYFSPSVSVAGNVNIKNNCFFGINSTIINDITIANKTLVGASCCLRKNTQFQDAYISSNNHKLNKLSTEVKIK